MFNVNNIFCLALLFRVALVPRTRSLLINQSNSVFKDTSQESFFCAATLTSKTRACSSLFFVFSRNFFILAIDGAEESAEEENEIPIFNSFLFFRNFGREPEK